MKHANHSIIALLLMLMLGMTGCASMTSNGSDMDYQDPNTHIDNILEQYQQVLKDGSSCHMATKGWSDAIDCEGLLREAMELYASYPNNQRVTMVTAGMLYQSGRVSEAAYLLDQILKYNRPRPEAALLRSRIAIEEGNLSRAKTLLQAQININPTHHELQELMASVHFLDRNYTAAFDALTRSERMGAPNWRTAYHRGLVFEKQEKYDTACQQYFSAIVQNPDFDAPQARLAGLSHIPVCYKLKNFVGS